MSTRLTWAVKGLSMEKWLGWGSIAVAGLLLVLFVLDLVAGTPFGGRWNVVDILGILSCALVVYMSFDVLKDLGFPGLGYKKKRASRESPAAEARSNKALLDAANAGLDAKTPKGARRVLPLMMTALEKDGRNFEPARNLAATLRPVLARLKQMDDNAVLEQCHSFAERCLAVAKELEDFLTKATSQGS